MRQLLFLDFRGSLVCSFVCFGVLRHEVTLCVLICSRVALTKECLHTTRLTIDAREANLALSCIAYSSRRKSLIARGVVLDQITFLISAAREAQQPK
jgi:hypothetical protein